MWWKTFRCWWNPGWRRCSRSSSWCIADAELRVKRLVEHRGMAEDDARARIAAQAADEQRRAVADIWLDNSGSSEALIERAREVWAQRITPFAHNLSAGELVRPPARLTPADPTWPDQAKRIVARLKTACGTRRCASTTSVRPRCRGWTPRTSSTFRSPSNHSRRQTNSGRALLSAGYPRIDRITADESKADARSTVARYDHSDDASLWQKRIHGSADPGRPTYVHLRVDGWPNQQFALLFVDWLVANPAVQEEYLAVKRRAEQTASGGGIDAYVAAKEPWFSEAYRRAWDWADASGWRPSRLGGAAPPLRRCTATHYLPRGVVVPPLRVVDLLQSAVPTSVDPHLRKGLNHDRSRHHPADRGISAQDLHPVDVGIILLVVGAILAILGSTGRAIGGRRHYF